MKRGDGAMHVAKIERRHGERVYRYWLVRRSVREGRRVRHETIANVSKLPAAALEALRRALAGEALVAAGELFATARSTRTSCTRRSTGWASARKRSSGGSPAATSSRARTSFTTSPPPTARAAP